MIGCFFLPTSSPSLPCPHTSCHVWALACKAHVIRVVAGTADCSGTGRAGDLKRTTDLCQHAGLAEHRSGFSPYCQVHTARQRAWTGRSEEAGGSQMDSNEGG